MSETITLRPISVVETSGTVSNTGRAYDNDLNTYASESCSLAITSTTSHSASSLFRLQTGTIGDALPSGAIIKTVDLFVKYSSTLSTNPSTTMYTWTPRFYLYAYVDGTLLKSYNNTASMAVGLRSYTIWSAETSTEPISSGSNFDVAFKVTGTGRKKASKYSSTTLGVSANIYEAYFIITYEMPTGVTTKVKVNGAWEEGVLKAKVNGEWVDATALYIKNGGSWIKIE